MPVYGTVASQFNDPGVNEYYLKLLEIIKEKTGVVFKSYKINDYSNTEKIYIIPPNRVRYLSEISETVRNYNKWAEEQSEIAEKLHQLAGSMEMLKENGAEDKTESLKALYDEIVRKLDPNNLYELENGKRKRITIVRSFISSR